MKKKKNILTLPTCHHKLVYKLQTILSLLKWGGNFFFWDPIRTV